VFEAVQTILNVSFGEIVVMNQFQAATCGAPPPEVYNLVFEFGTVEPFCSSHI
jgi:hypothetical protein